MSTTISKYFSLALTPFSKATPNTPSSCGLSFLFLKPFSSQKFRSRFYCSSSCAACSAHPDTITAAGDTEASPESIRHPWPEWVAFIDRLKINGYFSEIDLPSPENAVNHYKEMNLLKDACLRFARDRYDILKSLSMKDIEMVVEGGCPNLLRKAVNSAKRLRAYVRLDEGEVCSTCNLRGSCDRAYVILKGEEANTRTVDVVRLLLFYALDQHVISGGEKPPGRERVELSAKKLLSELLELNEASSAPAPWKPAAKPPPMSLMDDELSQNCEMKRGDWMCPKCNFMNFAKNLLCRKCKEDGPRSVGENDIEMKKGDWFCPDCNFMNFARNKCCFKCKTEKPVSVETLTITAKKGDWNCPKCDFMNFASNKKCLRCKESRPRLHGEWDCPSCDFKNFSRNHVCLKCNCKRPEVFAINV